jgi:hypothetical protein
LPLPLLLLLALMLALDRLAKGEDFFDIGPSDKM